MKIQLIRSATMKFYFDALTILTDPSFAPKLSSFSYAGISKNPLIDLPFSVEAILHKVDAVIVSHLHSDHFENTAKKAITKDIPLFCQPEDKEKFIKYGFINVQAISDKVQLKNIEMQRFYVQHGYDEVLSDMGIVSGFMLISGNVPKICWLGDTVLTDQVMALLIKEKPGVIITHSSGAVWGNNKIKIVMDDEQTVKVCKLLPESKVIAVHMDSYDHGTVSRKQLREYSDKNHISPSQLIIPQDGEVIDI